MVFSDGQVRDADAVRELAKSFAGLDVPIHVAPVGNMSGDGDVAIVGVVAPRRVRKYTDVDVQVFVRSYGYDGVTTDVDLVATDSDGTERQLNRVPITLREWVSARVADVSVGTGDSRFEDCDRSAAERTGFEQ